MSTYKLEHQVCTLEQAKEFDKFGLKLESYFVWLEIDKEKKKWILTTNHTYVKSEDFYEYSAYSCAELGVLLPKYLQLGNWINDIWYPEKWLAVSRHDIEYNLFIEYNEEFICGYMEFDSGADPEIIQKNQYEAHAKANLLIHLLKEKIIKSKDLTLCI